MIMLWEELTAAELAEACIKTNGTCIIPFGVIEKHGGHLPLGTDMILARKMAMDIANIEPVVIFPYYFFGQIAEARHVPGTIAIDPNLMYNILDEICREIARNGFKKIVILNSHGGNPSFIYYFVQSTLYKKKDYVVYFIDGSSSGPDERAALAEMLGGNEPGEHGGNLETSLIMAARPELVKMNCVEQNGLRNYGMLNHLKGNAYTAMWWYAEHPTHFAGEPFHANPEIGRKVFAMMAKRFAHAIKVIKEDMTTAELQEEFFQKN